MTFPHAKLVSCSWDFEEARHVSQELLKITTGFLYIFQKRETFLDSLLFKQIPSTNMEGKDDEIPVEVVEAAKQRAAVMCILYKTLK